MPERGYAILRLLLIAVMPLTACSIHTPYDISKSQHAPESRNHHQQLLSRLTRYQTRGSFAYRSQELKIFANFNWQQTSVNHYRLILTNPFGSIEMVLNVTSNVVQIVNKRGFLYISDDPEVIIQKLIGIYIPLNSLRHWMIGLPGDATDFTLDSRGYLHQLRYSHNGQHWTVTYQSYHEDSVPALPSTMELIQGDKLIKLNMHSWNL
ncbi:lipoprotein insertase outer membrane protein LolB [Sodalis endosymbiont of Henestaris halophilus]|uniref:lipoprotein insertase outer membrane protein LolB n=1 Tax=Sodalis endosymbiont of Henestaris halophilus TaxID=1929246 RepID=UPI000BC0F0A4|nr:lipoprotein insertase outer membrane protein LolB [Sodalis endosymbiont of Henestaris halophilus]SNC58792.1 Outer-membrane lipoprotein LolB precursor [Sodalis endosymbiont of Henestaris halophilus]